MNRRIFLVGAMGSGKTKIGLIMAEELNMEFLDNDYGLSKMISKSVDELSRLNVDALHTHESAYAQNLLEKSGEFIANLAASVGDNPELLNKFKAETTIYLHTSLEDQLLHSGTRGVGRQALVSNREEEIRSRYIRRDPRFRAAATFVAQASRDRNKDAQTILEFLKGQE